MCDQLELNTYHRLFIDTMLTLIKFSIVATNTNAKVLTLGVARVKGRGLSPLVY